MWSGINCGNCGRGCCCRCERGTQSPPERCLYCRPCDSNSFSDLRPDIKHRYPHHQYARKHYHAHYVCFFCQRGWKSPPVLFYQGMDTHMHRYKSREGRDLSVKKPGQDGVKEITCSRCNNLAYPVSHNVRHPKQKDDQAWTLLHKILETDFTPAKKNTLAWYWENLGRMSCTLHMSDKHRSLFWIPKKHSEYDRWFKYMSSTHLDALSFTCRP